MNEHSTIAFLNKKFSLGLIACDNEYSDFDAEDKHYIVEIKNRNIFYVEKLIECIKLFKNYQNAQLKGKDFLYVVTDEKGIYVFNLSKNINSVISTDIVKTKQPKTTDFNTKGNIVKYVYMLNINLCSQIINII
jgi:hypothetical protein